MSPAGCAVPPTPCSWGGLQPRTALQQSANSPPSHPQPRTAGSTASPHCCEDPKALLCSLQMGIRRCSVGLGLCDGAAGPGLHVGDAPQHPQNGSGCLQLSPPTACIAARGEGAAGLPWKGGSS